MYACILSRRERERKFNCGLFSTSRVTASVFRCGFLRNVRELAIYSLKHPVDVMAIDKSSYLTVKEVYPLSVAQQPSIP